MTSRRRRREDDHSLTAPLGEPGAEGESSLHAQYAGPIEFDNMLDIYGQYVESVRHYNTIIWQFPAAFITYNILALYYFSSYPIILCTIAVINFAMLHSMFKHIHNQGVIFAATREFEKYLKAWLPEELALKFGKSKGIIGWRSAQLVARLLLVLNALYFIVCAYSVQWRRP